MRTLVNPYRQFRSINSADPPHKTTAIPQTGPNMHSDAPDSPSPPAKKASSAVTVANSLDMGPA
jgi:hypothetical protein